MTKPIAYTYDADTHCPPCATERFGPALTLTGGVTDREGNEPGAIFPWDEWHDPDGPGTYTLACGTCHEVIDQCTHEVIEASGPDDECTCEACDAAFEAARLTTDPRNAS